MARAHSTRWTVFAAVTFLGVCALTLVPAPGSLAAIRATPWWCVRCGSAGTADLFQNTLLLLPLGFALARVGMPTRRAALLLGLFPLVIEITQAIWISGRDATLGDVVANAVGGMIGLWIGARARLPRRGDRHGWRWAALILGLFVAQLLATASLVQPSSRGLEPWQLSRAPEVAGKPVYHGELIALHRNGRAILHASDADAQGDPDDRLEWVSQFTWQSTAEGTLTPLTRLDDAHGWPLLAIDLRSSAVGIEYRSLGGSLRLRTPTWLAPVPPQVNSGDTVRVRVLASPGTVHLQGTVGDQVSARVFPVGAQHGWSLINPFTPVHRSPAAWHRWTLAWLVGWGVLIGVAAIPARRRWPWVAGALVGLAAVTMWSGTLIGLDEGAALLLGCLAGPWFSSAARCRLTPDEDAGTTSRRPQGPARP